ncbi:MAG: response regulator [Opitutaceae bacterium]
MKCLIASSDTLSRVAVQKLFTELGHPLQAVANGAAALIALLKPDGPELAILDVALPGLAGVDASKRVRESGRKVSVVLVGAKGVTEPPTGAEGLFDAFVARPFTLDAMKAAVTQCIEKAEAPAPALAEAGPAAAPAFRRPPHLAEAAKKPPVIAALTNKFASLTPLVNGHDLLGKALAGLGLESVTVVHPPVTPSSAEMSAWSVLVLPGKSVWIDLLVESDRGSMCKLFVAMTGNEEPSEDDRNDVMRETVNIVQGTFKTAFQKEKLEVFTPVLPKNIEGGLLASWREGLTDPIRYVFVSGLVRIAVTLFPKTAITEKRAAGLLRAQHVVLQPVHAPGCEDMVIVPKGTMLTDASLEKIKNIAEGEADGFTVEAIEHSPMTAALVRMLEAV